jgi:hypothetical protein
VKRDLENAKRLASALRDFGVEIGQKGVERFADEGRQMLRLGFPPQMVDILNLRVIKVLRELS